jgi:hypothetical protein
MDTSSKHTNNEELEKAKKLRKGRYPIYLPFKEEKGTQIFKPHP